MRTAGPQNMPGIGAVAKDALQAWAIKNDDGNEQ